MNRLFYQCLTAGSLLALLLSVGCSGTQPTSSSGKQENVLNKGNSAEPATLDPAKVEDYPSNHILQDLFEGLTAFGADSTGPDAGVIPGVAERWDISEDNKTYTFHLRHDAKWSNGKPVTADDFVYGIRRAIDPHTASPEAYLLYPIKNATAINADKEKVENLGVKALDPYTVQITLEAVTPYFLQIVANTNAFPIYKPSVDQWGDTFTQPGHLVSNGAYQLKEWTVNDHVTIVRNPNYWNNKNTAIDTVNYYPTSDTLSELKQYQSGQLDYTYNVPSDSFKELKEQNGAELHVSPWLGTFYYIFNLKKPSVENPKVRQALSMALDRAAMSQSVMPTGVLPQYHIVPSGVAGINTDDNVEWSHWPRDKQIAEAQKLYKEAGYSKEHPLKVTILYNTNDERKKIAVATQAMWHEVLGADVSLQNEEWKAWLSDQAQGNFEISLQAWIGDYNDPFAFLGLMTCDSSQNFGKYCDPQYDKLANEASHTGDNAKRQKLYTEAAKITMNAYARIPIVQETLTHLVKPYVGNYKQTQVQDWVRTQDWKIIKK